MTDPHAPSDAGALLARAQRDPATRAEARAQIRAGVQRGDVDAVRSALLDEVLCLLARNLRVVDAGARHPFVDEWSTLAGAELWTTVPAPTTYAGSAWKWDQIFGAEIAACAASLVERGAASAERTPLSAQLRRLARDSVLAVLDPQVGEGTDRGRIPHMRFSGGVDEELWGHPRRSSLAQPPVLSRGWRRLDDETQRATRPALLAELMWWQRERDDEGLAVVVHPWESGRDASVDFDPSLARFFRATPPASEALQTNNPGRKDEASKHARFALLDALGEPAMAADPRRAFAVACPDLNALLALEHDAVAGFFAGAPDGETSAAETAGDRDPADEHRERARSLRRAIVERLFVDDEGFFFARGAVPTEADRAVALDAGVDASRLNTDEQGRVRRKGAAALLALDALDPTDARDRARLSRVLDAMDGDLGAPLGLPTLSPTDAHYGADDYWRGSTWINVNALVVEALLRMATRAEAAEGIDAERLARRGRRAAGRVARHSLVAVSSGFFEYYDSQGQDPVGCGPADFCWSGLALLLVDAWADHGRA